jgi:beta-N-acetylhexosaminidase
LVRRLPAVLLFAFLAACASQAASGSGLQTFHVEHNVDALDLRGPGGLTFDEEVGAVMMVGFRGELTQAILDDWRQHQYGGLLVVNENANPNPAGYIRELRAVSRHRLLAATDQEGGTVCLALASIPCETGASEVGGPAPAQAVMTQMSSALEAQGFDVNLSPVADVWSGGNPFMRERSYGEDPALVSTDVAAAVAGVHAAGLLSAAKHFPGHGSADGNSHHVLPAVTADAGTLRARDWPPFRAATAAGVDFMMVAHLNVPALDAAEPTSLSPAVMNAIREQIGFRGVIISDDMQMGGLTSQIPTPEGAVRFLAAGGDMVIVAHDPGVYEATYAAIKAAVDEGRLPRQRLDAAVSHILALHR